MGEAYVFAPKETDCSTIGLCGRLFPTEIKFHMVANGDLSLTMEHPVDPWGKYTYLNEEYLLKVDAPVRTTPEIENGTFVTVVERWKVKNTATKDNRYLYSAKDAKNTKKLQLLPVGAEVVVVAKYENDSDRWKVKYTYEVKSGSKVTQKTVTGYMAHDTNTLQMMETVTLPETNTGIEQVAPSWEISPQIFRIYKVEKKTDGVTVYALHGSYDLMRNLTDYENDESATLAEAAQGIFDGCLDEHSFTFQTNVDGEKAGFHFADKDPVTALLDPDVGIIPRWGAQLIRDNDSFVALDNAGTNRGVFFEYGKNVEGIEITVDTSSVASAIRPVGEDADGHRLYLEHSVFVTGNGTTVELEDTKGIVYGPSYHVFIDDVMTCTLPRECIYPLSCEECKVDTKNGVTAAIVRARMLEQAIAALVSSEQPTVSVSIDMAQLAYSREWDKYKDLHKIFLYDTAQARFPTYGFCMNVTVSEMEWDGINDKPTAITLGSVINASPSIAGWQISSLSGSKLMPGTVGGSSIASGSVSGEKLMDGSITGVQLADGCVTARVIQAQAITADAIAANAITAGKIAAGAVTADSIGANAVTAGKIAAGAIDAQKIAAGAIEANHLSAGSVDTNALSAGAVTADKMQAGTITAESGIIANGAIGTAQIADGSITDAKVVSLNADVINTGTLAVSRLVLVGDDGLIYELNAQSAGLTSQQLTDDEYKSHLSGTVIVAKSITAAQIAAETITANEIAAGAITAGKIDVVDLFASNAFINQLNTTDITSNRYLQFTLTDLSDEAQQALANAGYAADIANNVSAFMVFTEEGLRQGKPESIYSTLISNTGFHIDREGTVGHIASFTGDDGLTVKSMRMGDIICRPTSKGGWVWQEA